MGKKLTFSAVAFLLISMLSSCEAIGDILKVGFYGGIFAVIAVLVIIFWLFSLFRRK